MFRECLSANPLHFINLMTGLWCYCVYICTHALCCVISVVCTLMPSPYPPLQKRHLNMTIQDHKTQKVLVMGRLIASISTAETASDLKTRLEKVKLEWELVSSKLPLRIAELEYKRNVQVQVVWCCSYTCVCVCPQCVPFISSTFLVFILSSSSSVYPRSPCLFNSLQHSFSFSLPSRHLSHFLYCCSHHS